MSGFGVLGAALPVAPFLAALAGLLLPPGGPGRLGDRAYRGVAAGLGIGGAAVALLAALVLALRVDAPRETGVGWIDFGGLTVTLGVRLDPSSVLVAVAVAAVALAVQVYSVGYLGDDDRYAPYAAQVSLFTAAMLLVVVAGDLIMLLVGWEVMGICSYLLIGHDRRLPEAPAAAVKAFLVTRVGDVGFLLGIATLGVAAGSFRIADVLGRAAAGALSTTTIVVACLLLLAGVAGKSAQFPLHTWLPDAMAGPTPISALIHAATMVVAGIYLVTRLYPLFLAAPVSLAVLGVMAAVTLLLGALAATAQDDIKRVLAWSTVSQIGYLAGALAVGSTGAATFHLLTHAAFKALLFLAAGCVIHAVGTNLMSAMGGLRRDLPLVYWCTVVGLGALAGLPPLAGFWSKDTILYAAQHAALDRAGPAPGWVGWTVWLAALTGVAVTAWYCTRLLLRTFHGSRLSWDRPHPPGPAMRWPVLLLAVPSALLGLAVFAPRFREALDLAPLHLDPLLLLPLGLVVLAAAGAWLVWRRGADVVVPAFARAFWLDDLQHTLVVRPTRALASAVLRGDESIVDGAVEGTGRGAAGLGARLAARHRVGVPGAVAAVLLGAVVLGLVAVAVGGAG